MAANDQRTRQAMARARMLSDVADRMKRMKDAAGATGSAGLLGGVPGVGPEGQPVSEYLGEQNAKQAQAVAEAEGTAAGVPTANTEQNPEDQQLWKWNSLTPEQPARPVINIFNTQQKKSGGGLFGGLFG